MYNYIEEMKDDIRDYIKDTYTPEEVSDLDFETLNDDLWVDDSVTGNASGSYTFNRATAKEYVLDNMELLKEACEEFCVDYDTIGKMFFDEDWETADVTIRCYLLRQAICEVLAEDYDHIVL